MLSNAKILVVVAHPDDELLGLGATIHHLIADHSCQVKVVILGEGITSRSDDRDVEKWKSHLEIHTKNIESAKDILGYQELSLYDFPDNRFDGVELLDIIKVIEKEKLEFAADVIFTHHRGDLNVDHQRTNEAVFTATRPMEHEKVKTIITFETPSSTEWQAPNSNTSFLPNLFMEVSKESLSAKINAMECYENERRSFPHPRSPESLRNRAGYWGAVIGVPHAEAFQIQRSIKRL